MLFGIVLNCIYIILQLKSHYNKKDCYVYYILDHLVWLIIDILNEMKKKAYIYVLIFIIIILIIFIIIIN